MPACLVQSDQSPVDSVQIWTAHLDLLSSTELADLSAVLDSSERARAERFRFERDRKHYVGARGILRRLLGAALDQPASDLAFHYGANGKPAIMAKAASDHSLRFNVSHSGGWAMFALARDREVGIDLESGARLDHRDDDLSGLAARVLSRRELALWGALPDIAARRAAFLRAWTRKEACAKATGEGVADKLRDLEVLPTEITARSLPLVFSSPRIGGATRQWIVHDLAAPEGFAAALAVEQTRESLASPGD